MFDLVLITKYLKIISMIYFDKCLYLEVLLSPCLGHVTTGHDTGGDMYESDSEDSTDVGVWLHYYGSY